MGRVRLRKRGRRAKVTRLETAYCRDEIVMEACPDCFREKNSFLRGGSLYIVPGILDTTRQRHNSLQSGTMMYVRGEERSIRIAHPLQQRPPTTLHPIHQASPTSPLSILSRAPRILALSFSSSLAQPFLLS